MKRVIIGLTELDIVSMVVQPAVLVAVIAAIGSLALPPPLPQWLIYIHPRGARMMQNCLATLGLLRSLQLACTGTSQVLITGSRLRGLSALSPALRADAGLVECNRRDLWNRWPIAANRRPWLSSWGRT